VPEIGPAEIAPVPETSPIGRALDQE